MSVPANASVGLWPSQSLALRNLPESPLSRFRKKMASVGLPWPKTHASSKEVLHTAPTNKLMLVSSTTPISKKPRKVPARASSSIEFAILLKIRESKQLRGNCDRKQSTPARQSLSSQNEKVSPAYSNPQQELSLVNRESQSTRSSRPQHKTPSTLFELQHFNRRLHRSEHDLTSAIRQTDAYPQDPPIPHQKPEMPSIPTLTDSLCKAGNVSGPIPLKNIVTGPMIEATKLDAAINIQRCWRRKKVAKESGAPSPTCVIVVDNMEIATTRPPCSQSQDVPPPVISEQAQVVVDPLDLEPSITTTEISSFPAVWSEDELSFLEEGRAAAEVLLDGKGSGARIEDSELVWKFPQKVVCKREAERIARMKSVRRKKKVTDSNIAEQEEKMPTVDQEAAGARGIQPDHTSSKTQPNCLFRHNEVIQSSHRSCRLVLRRRKTKKPSSRIGNGVVVSFVSKGTQVRSHNVVNHRAATMDMIVDSAPNTAIPVVTESPISQNDKAKHATISPFGEFDSLTRANNTKGKLSTNTELQDNDRNDLISVGDLIVAGRLLRGGASISGWEMDDHVIEVSAANGHLIPLAATTQLDVRDCSTRLTLAIDALQLSGSGRHPALGWTSLSIGRQALPGSCGTLDGEFGDATPSSDGPEQDNQELTTEDLQSSYHIFQSVESANALAELDARTRRVLGDIGAATPMDSRKVCPKASELSLSLAEPPLVGSPSVKSHECC